MAIATDIAVSKSVDEKENIIRRSRSGCLTCRRRKKRCDECRPICNACMRLRLQCTYPLPGDRKNKKKKKTGIDLPAAEKPSGTSGENLVGFEAPFKPESIIDHSRCVEFSPSLVGDLSFPLHFTDVCFESLDASSAPPPPLDLTTATYHTPEVPDHLNTDNSTTTMKQVQFQPMSCSSSDVADAEPKPTLAVLKQTYPDLGPEEIKLFQYFRDKQSQLMSVSTLNHFRSVFLAMSLRFKPVLHGILAWASFHSGNEEMGKRYLSESAKYLQDDEVVPRSKEEVLAVLLIMASAKICSGDVSDWRQYMLWAAKVIHQRGGLTSFMESESVRWLLKNFAYKSIMMTSSLSAPTLFSSSDFEFIFSQSTAKLPDSLCACCEPIFVTFAMINELSREIRVAPNDDDLCFSIQTKAYAIEQQVWKERPDPEILINLDSEELKLQVMLFEAFQQVAVLHLYQSVLRLNSSCVLIRCGHHHLLKFLTPLLTTQVEGCLIFPLFIAGICCADAGRREWILELFAAMSKRISAGNVQRVESLMKEVWLHDENGNKYVDWNEIADNKGLTFSFA